MSFFPPPSRTQIRILHCIYLSCLFSSPQISHFPCLWWPGQFWGMLVRCFVECSSDWVSLIFFHDYSVIYGWEENHRNGVSFSWHHIKECKISICPTTDDGNLDHLIEVVSATFLHCRGTGFPAPTSICWKQVPESSSHAREGESSSNSW